MEGKKWMGIVVVLLLVVMVVLVLVEAVEDGNVLDGFGEEQFVEFEKRLGWWRDGQKWFDVVGQQVLRIRCNEKATGVYYYVPRQVVREGVTGLSIGFEVRYEEQVAGSLDDANAFQGAMLLVKFARGARDRVIRIPFDTPTFGKELNFDEEVETITVVLACSNFAAGTVLVSKPFLYLNRSASSSLKMSSPETCAEEDAFLVEHYHFGTHNDNSRQLTLVNHGTRDRLYVILEGLKVWQDHWPFVKISASIALFDSDLTDSNLLDKIRDHGLSEEYHSLDFSIVRGTGDYPINYLRNLALEKVHTKYAFLLDADIIPGIGSDFEKDLETLMRRESHAKEAFVVPVFEDGGSSSISQCTRRNNQGHNKRLAMKKFSVYKHNVQPRAQRATDFSHWEIAEEPFVVPYEPQFEPYLIMNMENIPIRFDERFTGYGWNKASFVADLATQGLEFVVLPNSWCIHCNHEKTVQSTKFSFDLETRLRNRGKRYEWLWEK